jgi:MFS family permease
MGISCVTAYLLFYLQDKIYPNPPDHDTKPQEVLLIVNIIAAACAVVGSVVSGKLTDMFGGRKLFIIISAAFFIGALLLIAFVTQQ